MQKKSANQIYRHEQEQPAISSFYDKEIQRIRDELTQFEKPEKILEIVRECTINPNALSIKQQQDELIASLTDCIIAKQACNETLGAKQSACCCLIS